MGLAYLDARIEREALRDCALCMKTSPLGEMEKEAIAPMSGEESLRFIEEPRRLPRMTINRLAAEMRTSG